MDNDKPKITSKMLDELLSNHFSNSKYPKDKREGDRKLSMDVKKAVQDSSECVLAIAQIVIANHDIEGLALTAFMSGIVLGYRLKELQIEKIIDDVEKS